MSCRKGEKGNKNILDKKCIYIYIYVYIYIRGVQIQYPCNTH